MHLDYLLINGCRIVDNGIGEMEDLYVNRRKRQAYWDKTWELRRLDNITSNFAVDNYR